MENGTTLFAGNRTRLRIDDLICTRCGVQPTTDGSTVCELCRALGKTVDPVPEKGVWSDLQFGGVCAKRLIFGLNLKPHRSYLRR